MSERIRVEIPRHIFERIIPLIDTSVVGVISWQSAFVGAWQKLSLDYPQFESTIQRLGGIFIRSKESLDDLGNSREDSRRRRADVLRMRNYFPTRVFEQSRVEQIRNFLALILIARLHVQDIPINATSEEIGEEAGAILDELKSDRIIGSHTTNMTDIARNILEGKLELPPVR
jgi:hypothetical protein